MTIFNIEKTFTEKAKRRWNKIFIAVDVHDVILEAKYSANSVDYIIQYDNTIYCQLITVDVTKEKYEKVYPISTSISIVSCSRRTERTPTIDR
jgi:hypothetical protein